MTRCPGDVPPNGASTVHVEEVAQANAESVTAASDDDDDDDNDGDDDDDDDVVADTPEDLAGGLGETARFETLARTVSATSPLLPMKT